MENLSELLDKITLNTYEPGSSYWVNITHINNPHSFYVRPTAYRPFLKNVEAKGDLVNPHELHPRSIVTFRSKILRKRVRGLIVFIHNTNEDTPNYDLFALDYGITEKNVPLRYICLLKIPNIPALAVHCKLADCKPINDKWTDEVVEAMKTYVGDERAKLHVRKKTPELLTVEVINSCPDDIATMLALTGYTTLGYEENSLGLLNNPPSEKHYFTYRQLKLNDNLHVCVLSRDKNLSNGFYMAEMSDYKVYKREIENFTYYCKKKEAITFEDLEINKPVGVFMDFDYKYQRGIVKEVLSENKARVQLVDLGNIVDVPLCHLKSMSGKFFHYPAIAIYCIIHESQCSPKELHKLYHLGRQLLIVIQQLGDKLDKPYLITYNDLFK